MHDKHFELPTNIKQIGNIGDGMKIYAEDYVCTYMRQYAESGGHNERIAFLVGKHMVVDGEPYLFINGLIQGKHSQFSDNMEVFTEESYAYAEEELARYFDGGEIVGWMQSQPGYGVHLNPAYADYHMNNFTRPHHVLFVIDPHEKMNMFYAWNDDMQGISEREGYFVYYDQNKGMQEYMGHNKITKVRNRDEVKAEKAAVRKIFGGDEKDVPTKKLHRGARDLHMQLSRKEEKSKERAEGRRKPMGAVRTTAPKGADEYRKVSNLLIGLCAVLFIVSFIMGAGLIQSDSRIAHLEDRILVLDSTAAVLHDQLRQLAAMPVFAMEHQQIPTQAAQPEPPPHTPPPEQLPTLATPPPQQPTPTTPQPTPQPPQPTPTPPQPTPPPATPEPPVATVDIANQPMHFNVPTVYTIQPGDSLYQISRMFFGNTDMVARIMELNNITDPNMITAGSVIYLPQYLD